MTEDDFWWIYSIADVPFHNWVLHYVLQSRPQMQPTLPDLVMSTCLQYEMGASNRWCVEIGLNVMAHTWYFVY